MARPLSEIPPICLDPKTVIDLMKVVASELQEEDQDIWIDEKEAMQLLRITSKTTFQKYRDSGGFDFRRLNNKKILYRKKSILAFIENSPSE